MAMFSPMSSGRDSWQTEPASLKPGRFRAHFGAHPSALAAAAASNPSGAGPSSQPLLGESLSDYGAAPTKRARPSYAPAAARRRERLRSGRTGVDGSDISKRKRWWINGFRPGREVVEQWLDSWWKRWGVLAIAPCAMVWFWCAVPFPKTDPYDPNPPWYTPDPDVGSNSSTLATDAFTSPVTLAASSPGRHAQLSTSRSLGSVTAILASHLLALLARLPGLGALADNGGEHAPEHLAVDANFWFFLFFYYGLYVAVALIYITQLFSLYRLNWWPAALGAKTSYTFFWLLSLGAGWVLHSLDPLGTENKRRQHGAPAEEQDDIQWQRKTLWVGLAFATMAMPALVCLTGLRRSGRQTYRHSLTDTQKTFLERQLARRIPASYIRFLWFMSTIGLALFALVAGQGYASVYLSTLPHTGLDGTAYVTFWMTTVNVLAVGSHWILEEKVRSRALLFVNKYYYFLVYFIFYRNLFARLRSFDQFALVQLLSSFWVCIWYPFSMSSLCHRVVQYFNPQPKSWEEYVESVGLAFYLRNLAQNTTMIAFLGWVSILHFGPNQQLYPFFAFDDGRDPYNYQLTMFGSLAIWASELLSSWVAREICKYAFQVDVTNLGLDEMREYPEIVPTCVWTSVHVLMDMLLFLIKLNFR